MHNKESDFPLGDDRFDESDKKEFQYAWPSSEHKKSKFIDPNQMKMTIDELLIEKPVDTSFDESSGWSMDLYERSDYLLDVIDKLSRISRNQSLICVQQDGIKKLKKEYDQDDLESNNEYYDKKAKESFIRVFGVKALTGAGYDEDEVGHQLMRFRDKYIGPDNADSRRKYRTQLEKTKKRIEKARK